MLNRRLDTQTAVKGPFPTSIRSMMPLKTVSSIKATTNNCMISITIKLLKDSVFKPLVPKRMIHKTKISGLTSKISLLLKVKKKYWCHFFFTAMYTKSPNERGASSANWKKGLEGCRMET